MRRWWFEPGDRQRSIRITAYSGGNAPPVEPDDLRVPFTVSRVDLTDTHNSETITHRNMRTNIEIDDRLMRQAMRSSAARTKRAVVEEALRLLVQTRGQAAIRRLRGTVTWEGDLNASRLARVAR